MNMGGSPLGRVFPFKASHISLKERKKKKGVFFFFFDQVVPSPSNTVSNTKVSANSRLHYTVQIDTHFLFLFLYVKQNSSYYIYII